VLLQLKSFSVRRSQYRKTICYTLLATALSCNVLPAQSVPNSKAISEGPVGAQEGPAWDGHGHLYFTSPLAITQRDLNQKFRITRKPSNGAGGLLFDFQGRLIICEASTRRVVRVEPGGKITVLAETYESHRFNSPNDLTIDSRGRIYFSDPRYGNRQGMEMKDQQGQTYEGVYRIDSPGRISRILGHEVERANGVLVSPRDEFLYVADNNNNAVGGARKLWRFRLRDDGTVDLATRTLIFDWGSGRGPDGLKMDVDGRLYVAAGLNHAHLPFETADKFKGGVYVLSGQGKLLNFISIPVDEVTNCAFGNGDLMTLFVTAGGTLWRVPVATPGWSPKPAAQ
jgi:gluconolactonase